MVGDEDGAPRLHLPLARANLSNGLRWPGKRAGEDLLSTPTRRAARGAVLVAAAAACLAVPAAAGADQPVVTPYVDTQFNFCFEEQVFLEGITKTQVDKDGNTQKIETHAQGFTADGVKYVYKRELFSQEHTDPQGAFEQTTHVTETLDRQGDDTPPIDLGGDDLYLNQDHHVTTSANDKNSQSHGDPFAPPTCR
jgi:hypothetical protein